MFFGFLILAALTATLLAHAQAQAVLHSAAWGLPMALILAGVLFQYRNEWLRYFRTPFTPQPRATPGLTALAVVGGAATTFILANALDLGPVVAASLTGLFGAVLSRAKAPAVYCGTFVGMVSQDCLYPFTHLALAALLAAGVFLLAAPVFNGFGGKLGTIAFTGCVMTAWLTGNPLSQAPIPSAPVQFLVVLFAAGAATATFSLSVRLKIGPVIASSLIGLAGGLGLPRLMPETGGLLAVVVFCASFTGMSSQDRLRDERWLALAGLATGAIFIFTLPAMGGAGGKLGTIAFASALAVKSLADGVSRRQTAKQALAVNKEYQHD